jgi:hypothetical protein
MNTKATSDNPVATTPLVDGINFRPMLPCDQVAGELDHPRDVQMWSEIRRGHLAIIRAIEKRYGLGRR